jgi:hypothetical protein
MDLAMWVLRDIGSALVREAICRTKSRHTVRSLVAVIIFN